MDENRLTPSFTRIGLLALMIIVGVLLVVYCYRAYPPPARAALAQAPHAFGKSLSAFEQQTDSVLKQMTRSTKAIDEAHADRLFALPFSVLAYNGDSLVFWNRNDLMPSADAMHATTEYSVQPWKNGYYLQRLVHIGKLRYVFVQAVNYDYSTTNEYLTAGYNTAFKIDPRVAIHLQPVSGAVSFAMPGGATVYFSSNPDYSDRQTHPRLFILYTLALLLLLGGVYGFVQPLLLRLSFDVRLAVHLALIGALHASFVFVQPAPAAFLQWDIFSPDYYASPNIAGSLGMLFVELCLVFYASVQWYQGGLDAPPRRALRLPLLVFEIAAMGMLTAAVVCVVRSLVLDSNIPFEFFNPFLPDYKNLLAMLTATLLLLSWLMMVLPVLARFSQRIRWQRAVTAALTLAAVALVFWRLSGDAFAALFMLSVCVAFMGLQYLLRVRSVLQGSVPSIFLFLIALAGFYAACIHWYDQRKEMDLRLAYARKLLNDRDNVTEYLLGETRAAILNDAFLKNFFEHPHMDAVKLTDWLDRRYFSDGFNRFNVRYYFYDANDQPIRVRGDTAVRNRDLISNSEVCDEHELYFVNEPVGSFSYVAEYPVAQHSQPLGTLMVQLTSKVYHAVNVYPELLLKDKNKLPPSHYAYAVYANKLLTDRSGSYDYPSDYNFEPAPTKDQDSVTFQRNGYSHLVYRRDASKAAVVSLPLHQPSRLLSHFSYLFGMLFIGWMVLWLILYAHAWTMRRVSLDFFGTASFRAFIQFSFFVIILSAVLIIGLFTGRFFVIQFNRNTESRLNEKLEMVMESSNYLVQNGRGNVTATKNDALALLRENVSDLSDIQDIDINYYSLNGDLIATSQPAIFEKGLLSRKVNPRALYLLSNQSLSNLVQRERIGGLRYLSGYQPIRMRNGQILAYLNLPFFNTTRDLNEQIGLFFSSLTTILVFALIAVGLLAPLVSRRITRRLNIIADKFKQVTLGRKNEAIEWHTRDELGSLVEEFNKMIYKLEQSAQLLARSERESAWREMAKQVAHEIKNPLTPMKLSIQHLQRAIAHNAPNKDELTKKVSTTLIEQIDNLSKIAGEFSSFAKMPVPSVEAVPLEDVVQAAVDLFKENETVHVSFAACNDAPVVMADRSQLLRVFNNLVLNAVQAIPEGKPGVVSVTCNAGERFVSVRVSDNGAGISAADAEKMFVPNFTTKSSGTGLGLAISKNIVESMGGSIGFSSNDDGTTFTVELPRAN